ncbi:MAG: ABC transporter substrate-binding protein [Vicinamibacterales bacterium]|nr:ABC transporter substrate-binding protein [Vicinamibacterales bacterium]
MDDHRGSGEHEVGVGQPHREQGDSLLPGRARARAATRPWPRRLTPRLVLAGTLSAFGCTGPSSGPAPAAAPREPITLTIGVPQSRQIDPNHGAPVVANNLAFERLTTSDAEGRTQPRLLEGWSVSGDGLTWRLFVRPGVKFQDGTPLTAHDVKRTFDEVIADPNSRNLRVCLPNVASIVAASDREAVFTLTRRCSYLLDDLDRAISRSSADGASTVGTGAFAITSSSDEEVRLEANRHYHAGPLAIDRVVVRPFDTLRTAWAGMMRGQVDFLWEVGPESAEFLSDRAAVEVRSFLGFYAYALMLNSARPPFASPEVRRAFDMAVNRAAIVQQALRGRGVAADGPVWPNYWARDPRAPAAAFDPAEASALLRAARRGPVEFTCLVPANFSILERMALLVQQQLSEINVRMRLELLPLDAFNRRILSGQFDAAMISILGGPYATIFHRFWHSAGETKRWNFWGYRNARVDEALDSALEAASEREFREAIRRFEVAVRDDPPAVFLAWNQTVQAVSRRYVVPAEGAGRDAVYVLNRWQLRQPGSAAR